MIDGGAGHGGATGTFDRSRRTRRSCPTPPLPACAHPLHRHPREGGDPGLPPCGGRRHGGLRPGGRERRRADRGVVASGHRSFLWRPTWIPAFAGMTVFLLCRDGRRWCRTGALVVGRCGHGQRRCRTAAWVVGRCGHGRRQCRTAAAVVGRCGHGQQRYRTAAAVVRRRGHDRWRCRQCRRGAHGPPFPQNPAPMSDTTPTRSAPHPLHRHPREGGDPGLPPCEDRRQTGHRPGGRRRRRADRGVVASDHRSFL